MGIEIRIDQNLGSHKYYWRELSTGLMMAKRRGEAEAVPTGIVVNLPVQEVLFGEEEYRYWEITAVRDKDRSTNEGYIGVFVTKHNPTTEIPISIVTSTATFDFSQNTRELVYINHSIHDENMFLELPMIQNLIEEIGIQLQLEPENRNNIILL